MNLLALSGRLYNGAVYGYEDNDGNERTCFRGRLNFRLPNGKYDWIDVVCFRDNPHTEENGLVGWLEQNYLAPEDESEGHGGKAVELVGWLKPTEKKKTITVKTSSGKKQIPNVPYMTFELVIDQANFPPLSHGEGGRDNGVEVDDDFDLDDVEVAEDDDNDADEDQDEVGARRNQKKQSSAKSNGNARATNGRSDRSSTPAKNSKAAKNSGKSNRRAANDDDSFFVED